ncbi:MAG: TonB family protein [Planctomycetota bacterium]|jgi:protein TonB|nr:TonB family protein [Planctomycetota bacterium]MDP6763482.1 TonB family protein [Planctomycetota bacterium]MDP6990850.1 TonB family protein [Planctomycetota bacterium]
MPPGFLLGGLPPSSIAHLAAALALTQVGVPPPGVPPSVARSVPVAVVFDRPEPLPVEVAEPPAEVELPEVFEHPELVPHPVESEPVPLPEDEAPPKRALDPNLDLPNRLAALPPEPLVPRAPEPTRLAVALPEPTELIEDEPAPPPLFGPEVVEEVPVDYPTRARRLGQEGTVTLRALVGRDGTVLEVATVESSGHAALDRAARDAFRRWRFLPWADGESDPRAFTKGFTFRLTAL